MKKAVFLIVLLISTALSHAQPWMKNKSNRVKYLDAVAAYPKKPGTEKHSLKDARYGKAIKEDEHYHFGRWCWYWKQHLDTAGYLVGGATNEREWNKFLSQGHNAAAKTTVAANWIFEGPNESNGGYSGLGRINVIAFDPVDSGTLYVGSAGGSTWKTTDGGLTWKCLYDNVAALSVSDIRVNPQNRNTVYVATGDANGYSEYSTGVIKSYDGGDTWINTGLSWSPDSFKMVRSLLINPIDTNKLIVGSAEGLFKSNDGGTSWSKVATYDFRQVVFSPDDTALLYATTEPGSSAQIMRSSDGGYTWTFVTTFSNARRIQLAVTPAAPHVVKAIAANNDNGLHGIYSSSDYGATFIPVFTDDATCLNNVLSYDLGLPATACNGQGWYDLCIAIDLTDENKVLIGGINNYYSTDGGYTWEIANQWYNGVSGLQTVHADKHWLGYNPLNNALFLGCDGGIYKNYAPLTGKWIDLTNGIGITQFYRNAVANGAPFCLGGAQDNGTKMLNAGVATDLTGGDGMQCLINYEDPINMFYCAYQNGYVDITYDGGATFTSITEMLPTPGAWITPYVLHPTIPSTLFIAYKQVFASSSYGGVWDPISPIFDNRINIEILTIAPSNPDYIFAVRDVFGTSRSKIHFTTNSGGTWDTIAAPFFTPISDLVVDPLNEHRIWVTLSGYGTQKVYSHDLTSGIWTDESAGLPNMPVNCMVIDTFSQTRYIGNDAAVFYKTPSMSTWALYNTHLPGVKVYDLNINHHTNEIWAATFGRGMWKSMKADVTPSAVSTRYRQEDKIVLSPNPCHDAFTVSTASLPFRNAAVTVRLLTVDGKTALVSSGVFDNTGRLKVTIKDIAPGFYFCEVSNEKGMSRGKLVVY